MPGDCIGREESRVGILIWLIKSSHVSFPFICQPSYSYIISNVILLATFAPAQNLNFNLT